MHDEIPLTPELWARFNKSEQVLLIAAEMQRALGLLRIDDSIRLSSLYECVLLLTDLTLEVQENRSLRRELGLFRGVIEELSRREEPDPATHRSLLRVLLQLDPVAYDHTAALGS